MSDKSQYCHHCDAWHTDKEGCISTRGQSSLAAPAGFAPWRYYVIEAETRHIVTRHRTMRAAQVSLSRLRSHTSGKYQLSPAIEKKCPHCNGTGMVTNPDSTTANP